MILWLPKHILIVDLETSLLEILLSYLINPQPMILRVVCFEHNEVLLVIGYLNEHCFLLVVQETEFLIRNWLSESEGHGRPNQLRQMTHPGRGVVCLLALRELVYVKIYFIFWLHLCWENIELCAASIWDPIQDPYKLKPMTLTLIKILVWAVRNFPSLLLSLIFLVRWRKPLLELNSFDDPALLVLKVKKRQTIL
jgi:hypothetical protein